MYDIIREEGEGHSTHRAERDCPISSADMAISDVLLTHARWSRCSYIWLESCTMSEIVTQQSSTINLNDRALYLADTSIITFYPRVSSFVFAWNMTIPCFLEGYLVETVLTFVCNNRNWTFFFSEKTDHSSSSMWYLEKKKCQAPKRSRSRSKRVRNQKSVKLILVSDEDRLERTDFNVATALELYS